MNYTLEQMQEFLRTRSAWFHMDTLDLVVVESYSHANSTSRELVGFTEEQVYEFFRNHDKDSYDIFYEHGWVHVHFENNRYGAKLWAIFTPDPTKFTKKAVAKLKMLAEVAGLSELIYGDGREHETIVEIKQYAL